MPTCTDHVLQGHALRQVLATKLHSCGWHCFTRTHVKQEGKRHLLMLHFFFLLCVRAVYAGGVHMWFSPFRHACLL